MTSMEEMTTKTYTIGDFQAVISIENDKVISAYIVEAQGRARDDLVLRNSRVRYNLRDLINLLENVVSVYGEYLDVTP